MSRIGNRSIILTNETRLSIEGDGTVVIGGPKGKLKFLLPSQIRGEVKDNEFHLTCLAEGRKARALHGLARALIYNMICGVNDGFVKDLEIQGVGFKAAVQGNTLKLNLGYSHEIFYQVPPSIKIGITDGTKLRIEGIDRQLVGQVAADIRRFYPPEPYKGKGVRYAGERIVRKEGKTVQ